MGATKVVSLVFPKLTNGISLHVPIPNVSVVDLVVNIEKKWILVKDVKIVFRNVVDGPLKGILIVSDLPLVSMTYIV